MQQNMLKNLYKQMVLSFFFFYSVFYKVEHKNVRILNKKNNWKHIYTKKFDIIKNHRTLGCTR